MIVFDFLFYSLFKVFNSIKRVGVRDEDLAATFFPILLTINSLMILIIIQSIMSYKFENIQSVKIGIYIISISLFIGWNRLCKIYFTKHKNDQRIISMLDLKYSNGKNFFMMIGIFYTLLTFIGFIGILS